MKREKQPLVISLPPTLVVHHLSAITSPSFHRQAPSWSDHFPSRQHDRLAVKTHRIKPPHLLHFVGHVLLRRLPASVAVYLRTATKPSLAPKPSPSPVRAGFFVSLAVSTSKLSCPLPAATQAVLIHQAARASRLFISSRSGFLKPSHQPSFSPIKPIFGLIRSNWEVALWNFPKSRLNWNSTSTLGVSLCSWKTSFVLGIPLGSPNTRDVPMGSQIALVQECASLREKVEVEESRRMTRSDCGMP
ncbi:uncharacterized protein LOC103497642 [Cucumis melo]|uniref:Uncharacterized protein LOC103497642 n=1 Tax=Cucumis melo TaxID=3656 RepID=A0ABM3KKR7_CUCME|nr:uncharacterized protein LOC103497642 [Cucumis melo]